MRDFKGMKRQRNRGRGGGGGGKPQHNANRAFDSNGPDGVKVRGAAQHIYEKYQQLARDAGSSGDRVLAENYLQHAEHYFRVLRAMQPQRPVGEIIGRDQFASGYDIDFEEESQVDTDASVEAVEGESGDGRPREERQDRPWRDERQGGRDRDDFRGQGEYRQRDDRQRDDRQGEFRQRDRDDRPRDDRPRDDRPREDRQQGEYRQRDDRYRDDRPRYRDDRPRDDRPRDDRSRDERPRDDRPRDDRPRFRDRDREQRQDRDGPRDPLGVIEPQAAAPLTQPAPYEPDEPRGGMLRGEDGTESHAPAFLQSRAPQPRSEGDEEVPQAERRPRRRRAPRTFEGGDASPAEADEG